MYASKSILLIIPPIIRVGALAVVVILSFLAWRLYNLVIAFAVVLDFLTDTCSSTSAIIEFDRITVDGSGPFAYDYDFEDKKFDLCNLQCSLEDVDDEKTNHDHSKLISKRKTNIVSLYNAIDDIPIMHMWIIRACGLKLYVYI